MSTKKLIPNDMLRESLKEIDQTKAEFARVIGVTVRTVELWLRGQVKMPSPAEILLKLLVNGTLTPSQIYEVCPITTSKLHTKLGKPIASKAGLWERLETNARRVVNE